MPWFEAVRPTRRAISPRLAMSMDSSGLTSSLIGDVCELLHLRVKVPDVRSNDEALGVFPSLKRDDIVSVVSAGVDWLHNGRGSPLYLKSEGILGSLGDSRW